MGLTVMIVGMAEVFIISGSLYIGMKVVHAVDKRLK